MEIKVNNTTEISIFFQLIRILVGKPQAFSPERNTSKLVPRYPFLQMAAANKFACANLPSAPCNKPIIEQHKFTKDIFATNLQLLCVNTFLHETLCFTNNKLNLLVECHACCIKFYCVVGFHKRTVCAR